MKHGKLRALVLVLLAGACSDSAPPPTLAAGTTSTAVSATTVTTTSTTSTTSTTTTTSTAPTTTNADQRRAEIAALGSQAFVGREAAVFNRDKDELFRWVGSRKTYEFAAQVIDDNSVDFIEEPTAANSHLIVLEVKIDRFNCVAALVQHFSEAIDGEPEPVINVWFPTGDGRLTLGAQWEAGTSTQLLEEECDLILRDWRS